MRLTTLCFVFLFLAGPLHAENAAPYSGVVITETGKPFADYVKTLSTAIKSNKMGIVAQACATCGAKSIGKTIAGNRVIMVFNPHFAVRMLEASISAGVEAPLRLYITEKPDGMARLSYRLPSHVFTPYGVDALDVMAEELDGIFAKIAVDAGK